MIFFILIFDFFFFPSFASFFCFPFSFSSECSYPINYSVSQDFQLQQKTFEQIQWTISDIRMLPNTCRRSIIRCLCSITFPLCQDDLDEQHSVFVCESVCNVTIRERCDGIINATDLDLIISSFLADGSVETDPTQECFLPISSGTIPVTTCLPDGIKCCTGILNIDTQQQCSLYCVSSYEREDERTLEIILVVLAWVSFSISFFGVIPFLFDKHARQFPNHIPLCLILTATVGALIVTWGDYSSAYVPGSFVCNSDSGVCQAQALLFVFFIFSSAMYSFWLCYRISYSCYAHLEWIRERFPNLQNEKNHFVLVHGSTFAVSFGVMLGELVAFQVNSGNIRGFPGGFCGPNFSTSNPTFYIFFIPMLILLFMLLLQLFFIFRRFMLASYVFFLMQFRATFTAIFYLIFLSNFIALVIVIAIETTGDNADRIHIQATQAYSCAASHPRDFHPPCKDGLYIFSYGYACFSIILISIQGGVIAILTCWTHLEVWKWWIDFFRFKQYQSISVRLNPTLSKNSHLSQVQQPTQAQHFIDKSNS
jgi:hypothetical protein